MDESGTVEGDREGAAQVFMALPEQSRDGSGVFRECLDEVARVTGLSVVPRADPCTEAQWGHAVRGALREAFRRGETFPEGSFDALLRAAVHDPDPSFDRWFVEAALNSFGRLAVCSALLDYLRTGSDPERAGAARAWYWAGLPLQRPESPTAAESEALGAVARDWNEACLRTFVGNEDVDVRRCILPGLRLGPSAFPAELQDLVAEALAIGRAHPDEYIRHRVEIQSRC